MPKLTQPTNRMFGVIHDLIYTDREPLDMQKAHHISQKTFYRWVNGEVDVFTKAYIEEKEKKQKTASMDIKYKLLSWENRVKELTRLYELTPDQTLDKVIKIRQALNAQGKPVQAGEPVASFQIREIPIQKLNTDAQLAIMDRLTRLADGVDYKIEIKDESGSGEAARSEASRRLDDSFEKINALIDGAASSANKK